MKKVRIISLGEIMPINLKNGIVALAKIIAEKTGMPIESIMPRVAKVAQAKAQMEAIDHFKQGLLTEVDFDDHMVKAYCDEFQPELKDKAFTTEDFNQAWGTMNPEFGVYAGALASAIQFNETKGCQLIFISYTNPKDMRHLQKTLDDNSFPYQLDSQGQLCEIRGIALYTSYVNNCTKPDLITKAVKKVMTDGPGLFAGNNAEIDIKYIHGVNGIQGMEAISKEFDVTNAAVQETAAGLHVDSILWNKQNMTLFNLLSDAEVVHGLINVAKL